MLITGSTVNYFLIGFASYILITNAHYNFPAYRDVWDNDPYSLLQTRTFDTSGRVLSEKDEKEATTISFPSKYECDRYNRASPKCYSNIGCFGPGHSVLDFLCRFPEEGIKVTFTLYTKSNRAGVLLDGTRAVMDNFLPASKTVFFFHGYTRSAKETEAVKIRDAILKFSDYQQVVLIDYQWAVKGYTYARAMGNSDYIGRTVGHFVNLLVSYRSLDPSKHVYFIGHSLGTHIAHWASRFVAQKTGLKVQRFTALDPAGPLTSKCPACNSFTDAAHFVDVIHSAAGWNDLTTAQSYSWGKLGMTNPVGHVDFYPNGGGTQLGCTWLVPFCDHSKCVEFFVKSFQSCNYFSVHCSSVNVSIQGSRSCTKGNGYGSTMGYYANIQKGRGVQYVEMNNNC